MEIFKEGKMRGWMVEERKFSRIVKGLQQLVHAEYTDRKKQIKVNRQKVTDKPHWV
jgi:hypothetical protein